MPSSSTPAAAASASHPARRFCRAAAFTPDGHLSYDIAVRDAFTFRFLDSGEGGQDIVVATGRAEEAAKAWLAGRGYGYKNLRSAAEDLSQMPLSKRQRRALAQRSG